MSRHFSREALLRLLRGPAGEAEAARALRHAVQCRRCRSRAAGRSDPFLGESLIQAALTVADLLPEPHHRGS